MIMSDNAHTQHLVRQGIAQVGSSHIEPVVNIETRYSANYPFNALI